MDNVFIFLVSIIAKMLDPIMLIVSIITGFICYNSRKKSILAGAIVGIILTSLSHIMSISIQHNFHLINYPSGILAGIILVWGTGTIRSFFKKKP